MDLLSKFSPYLMDNELINALSKSPFFESKIPLTKAETLIKLLDIYDVFIPTHMSIEIYNTLYFSLVRSINRKSQMFNFKQLNNNRKIINGSNLPSYINGMDSTLIIADSGMGKSRSISRAIEIITNNEIIKLDNPYCQIIPFLKLEASPNSSIKGFLLGILRTVDNILGTNYYQSNNRTTINTDALIGAVANCLIIHSFCLIIDEANRFLDNKKSSTFINYITELINMCGVSVIFVGTPITLNFFQTTDYLARRNLGNIYHSMEYGEEYYTFCKKLFNYQLTTSKFELNSELLREFYKFSKGNVALTVNLFIEVEKIAITEGIDKIDTTIIAKAFNQKMSIMTPFIDIKKTNYPPLSTTNDYISIPAKNTIMNIDNIFSTLSQKSNKDIEKAIHILKQSINIEVIQI